MTKLTKAEREELRRLHLVQSDPDSRDINRLLADLDAAEAKVRTQFQATFDELRKALGDDIGSEGGLCAILTGIETIRAQRDRAESELDAERKMRVEAEASRPFANDQGCDAVHHAVADRHDHREGCPVVARLRAAITAARGGAS